MEGNLVIFINISNTHIIKTAIPVTGIYHTARLTCLPNYVCARISTEAVFVAIN